MENLVKPAGTTDNCIRGIYVCAPVTPLPQVLTITKELTKKKENYDVIISSRYKYPVASREHSKYVWVEERVERGQVGPVLWWCCWFNH